VYKEESFQTLGCVNSLTGIDLFLQNSGVLCECWFLVIWDNALL